MRDEAEVAALGGVATAVTALLERLRAARGPTECATIRADFAAAIDGLRADLAARYGLDEGRSVAVVARSLARVIEAVRAAPD